jgi:nucleotide-binding universal stress UspA family protein
MMKLLLPTDGSPASLQAMRFLLANRRWFQAALEFHLLNIQQPVRGDVGRFLGQEQLRSYHHDEGMKALALARAVLDEAGVPYSVHVSVGDDAGAMIARFAREQAMDLIVMGKKGQSAQASALIGSVASSASRVATVPVMLVGE